MVRTFVFASFLSVVLFLSGCARKDVSFNEVASSPPGAGAFVKKANNLAGTVLHDPNRNRYGIQVATSMDTADVGFTCNLPTEYQQAGLKVRFSGSCYAYDKPVAQPVGYETYYLLIRPIEQ